MKEVLRVLLCSASLAIAVRSAPPAMVSTFPPGDVRLLDGPFKHAEELNRTWLLSLNPDRFLYHFRLNAGLPTSVQPYGGWEATDWDFEGHTLGHYLTACALMFASTGEQEFKRRIDHMVADLAECQIALARKASHAGFLDPLPESVFEKMESGAGGGGVPFYTMHKTLAGLLDAHTLGGNAQALEVLKGMAAWLRFRLDRLSPEQIQTMLRIEHGGINESLASLYGLTKNPDHLRLAAPPASYVTLDREWRDGDRVSVRLPMSLRAVPLPDDVSQVAFMFGLLVLAGQLGRDGLQFKPTETVDNGKARRGPRPPEEPVLVPGLITTATDAVAHLNPVAGLPLTFRTRGIGRPNDVTLVPLHRIVDENYTVYWKLFDEPRWEQFIAQAGPQETERRATQARIVDAVWAGHPDMEAAHSVWADTAPVVSSRMSLFRDATRGSVTWKLKATPGRRMTLRVGYVGAVTTAFDLFVDGQKIAEERPPAGTSRTRADRDVTTIKAYEIPIAVTAGKSAVEVRFTGHADLGTAHVVFCELSRVDAGW